MSAILDTVRRQIGRRHKITRTQMRDLLVALDMDIIAASTIAYSDDERSRDNIARVWADMCRGITCISVMPEEIRYDAPGSLHPMQHAVVTFMSSTAEPEATAYMRRHADCVLVVAEDSELPPLPPTLTPSELAAQECQRAAIARRTLMLRAELADQLDAPWSRILDDGVLEMIDPNDNGEARYQYRTHGGDAQRRRLPPESVGERWIDSDAHEWQEMERVPAPGSLLGDYFYACFS